MASIKLKKLNSTWLLWRYLATSETLRRKKRPGKVTTQLVVDAGQGYWGSGCPSEGKTHRSRGSLPTKTSRECNPIIQEVSVRVTNQRDPLLCLIPVIMILSSVSLRFITRSHLAHTSLLEWVHSYITLSHLRTHKA
jgi:hypothetical protein